MGVLADFGVVQITDASTAIYSQNTNAFFDGATLSNSSLDAVRLVANTGEQTIFVMQNSTINGAGGTAFSILANDGEVDASILSNFISATGGSLAGTSQGTVGIFYLDMVNNAGTGGPNPGAVSVTNAATFGISQSTPSTPPTAAEMQTAISSSNNAGTVTITNTGTLESGVTVPKP